MEICFYLIFNFLNLFKKQETTKISKFKSNPTKEELKQTKNNNLSVLTFFYPFNNRVHFIRHKKLGLKVENCF